MSDNFDREWRTAWLHGPKLAVFIIAMVAILAGGGLALKSVFAPASREIDRNTYEESTSYVHGMIRDLENLRLEYYRSEQEHRSVIGRTILHRAAEFDAEKLPPDLRAFVDSLKGGI